MSKKVGTDVVNPVVINDELIMEAIQIPLDEDAVDQALTKDKYGPERFHEVTHLTFSYKGARPLPPRRPPRPLQPLAEPQPTGPTRPPPAAPAA